MASWLTLLCPCHTLFVDSCPLCMSKRFIECPDCGGHYHRPMFNHVKPAGNS